MSGFVELVGGFVRSTPCDGIADRGQSVARALPRLPPPRQRQVRIRSRHIQNPAQTSGVCGAGGRIRTADLFITSESLCLLSHTSDCMSDYSKTLRKLQLLSIKKSSKSRSLRVLTKTQPLITKKERHCLSFVQVSRTAN